MLNDKKLRETLAEIGLEQKIKQEGIQKGISELLQFLKSGHSLEEAEIKFAKGNLQLA